MIISGDMEELLVSAATFNHCATLCPIRNGTLMAWYAGSGECRTDQSVHLLFITKHHRSKTLRLGDNTGNPVLWSLNSDTAVLLWSKFSSMSVPRLVDKWKHCDIWIQQVGVTDGIQLLGSPQLLAPSTHHLLGRCSPIRFKNEFYLPLYNELDRHGIIYSGDGWNMTECDTSRLGQNTIQPALWTTHARVHAMLRNFGNNKNKAQYCYSDDGVVWSETTDTTISNNNSSLATLNWGRRTMLMWNDTTLRKRERMMLGEFPNPGHALMLNKTYGAYPSMCENNDGSLSLAYTESNGIAYTNLTEQQYRDRRDDLVRTNSGDSGEEDGSPRILRVRRELRLPW